MRGLGRYSPDDEYLLDRFPRLRDSNPDPDTDVTNLRGSRSYWLGIARSMGMRLRRQRGRYIWKCRICGRLPDGPPRCDPAKHAAYYDGFPDGPTETAIGVSACSAAPAEIGERR